jgi:hypothetical protein
VSDVQSGTYRCTLPTMAVRVTNLIEYLLLLGNSNTKISINLGMPFFWQASFSRCGG